MISLKSSKTIFFLFLFCLFGFNAYSQATAEKYDDFVITREELDSMKDETAFAIEFIQRLHFKGKSFASIDSTELIVGYLESLDYAKMYFLKDDVDLFLQRFAPSIKEHYLVSGQLYPAFEMYKTYRLHALERFDWVNKRLQEPFDFTKEENYIIDRSEEEWSTNEKSLDDLWRRRLKYELIFELLNDEEMDTAISRLQKRYQRAKRNLLKIEASNVQETFLNSLTGFYDPHTAFFSADTAEDFNIAISNKLEGIGAMLSDEDGYCTITELMPGGPAEMSGVLNPGDKIIAVAQAEDEPVNVVEMKLSKIVQLIRGEKGSEVRLTILSSDSETTHIVPLLRDEIKITAKLATATVRQIPDENGNLVPIGVIELPSFYGRIEENSKVSTTSEDVEELIKKLQAYKIQGLVLDLRKNGGGLLSEAIRLVGLFIPKGPVVQVKYHTGEIRKDWDRDPSVIYKDPLVVLVSRNSASASEIVAGALQSLDRAIIIGDTSTHGKGTVQMPQPLGRYALQLNPFKKQKKALGTVKVTIQKFYLPDGASTQLEGVKSDIIIPNTNDYREIGESDLDNALEWDSISPVKWNEDEVLPAGFKPLSDDQLISLKEKSQKRIESEEEFIFLKEIIDRFKVKQERNELSLCLETRREEKEKDEDFRKKMEEERDRLSDKAFELTEVLLDSTAENEAQQQEKLHESTLPDGRSKLNAYYQKRFYYNNEEKNEIKSINVEYFDYEKILEHKEEIAQLVSDKTEIEIELEVIESILQTFKNVDRGPEFKVEETFLSKVDGLTEEKLQEMLPSLYLKLIEIDKDILLERAKLDIALREATRIMLDWITLNKEKEKLLELMSLKSAPIDSIKVLR